jgi:murein DD-endopeptidase MepM/ murein hydrolase activator NlpD
MQKVKAFFLSRKKISLLLLIIVLGFLIPENFTMPVKGADKGSYNAKSFWYYPWGKSGTHKGVDIFSKEGTEVSSSTRGLVLYTGNISMGGNVVLVLGPKWRLHYYAHLKEIKTSVFSYLSSGEMLGSVGTTGNAKGKAPHLHYSIITIVPYLWRIDFDHQGWKKMFYLDPVAKLDRI